MGCSLSLAMSPYSIEPRDRVFVKSYGFWSFTRNMSKNISKNLDGKYSQKRLDHAKQSAAEAFQIASKRAIHKTAEETGDLI